MHVFVFLPAEGGPVSEFNSRALHTGDCAYFAIGEHHAKGSTRGMTALTVQMATMDPTGR